MTASKYLWLTGSTVIIITHVTWYQYNIEVAMLYSYLWCSTLDQFYCYCWIKIGSSCFEGGARGWSRGRGTKAGRGADVREHPRACALGLVLKTWRALHLETSTLWDQIDFWAAVSRYQDQRMLSNIVYLSTALLIVSRDTPMPLPPRCGQPWTF